MSDGMRLTDGRWISYAEWGDPDGHPVLACHGVPGCRDQRYPDEALTRELGIRFIVPDRPGYGGSDPAPGYTLLDGAEDIGALAARLGIETFALHGISGGGPYALAAAWRWGRRVSRVALLACLGPLDAPDAFDGMWEPNVAGYQAAQAHLDDADPNELAAVLAGQDESPLPRVERSALARVPGLLRMSLTMADVMFRQGQRGVASDHRALATPWPFAVAEIGVPVALWHGDRDCLVPPQHSERVAARLPNAVVHRCPGEAHFSMFGHQREVLSFLAGGQA